LLRYIFLDGIDVNEKIFPRKQFENLKTYTRNLPTYHFNFDNLHKLVEYYLIDEKRIEDNKNILANATRQ
jgi:putative NIF3 family GTP cyclohydrolase 1 type 2